MIKNGLNRFIFDGGIIIRLAVIDKVIRSFFMYW